MVLINEATENEASVTIILWLHVLIAHHIFIHFGYVDYFH